MQDLLDLSRRDGVNESVKRDWAIITDWLGIGDIGTSAPMNEEQTNR